MFGIGKVFSAVNKLVANVQALAATVGEINEGLRMQLRLDGNGRGNKEEAPALVDQVSEAPTNKRRKATPTGNGAAE